MASGSSANVSIKEQQEKEEKLKKCVVHFRPKEDWRGGYGFDWVRLISDPYKEVINDEGHHSMSTLNCIGKYMCPAKMVKISAYKDDKNVFKVEQEVIPYDMGNYNDDLEGDPLYFCRNYIRYHGLQIPVSGNNAIIYELVGGKKIVEFTRVYTTPADSNVENKKKDDKGKKKKEETKKDQEKKRPELELLDVEETGKSHAEPSEKPERLELLDVDVPPEYTPYKEWCQVDYKYTFEKGKFKELVVKELSSQRKLTIGSKSELNKVSKKDKDFFRLKGDIIDACWKNQNMDQISLAKNTNNKFVNVDNEGSKTVVLTDHSGNTFTMYFEEGVMLNARIDKPSGSTRLKNHEEIKKKGTKAGLTEDMINDQGLDLMSLLKTLNYKSFSITMEQPKKLSMLPISYHVEESNGETKYVVDSFNGDDNADDRLLHEYWRDYTDSCCMKIRDPFGKFNSQAYKGIYWDVMDYFFPTLAIPYSENKEFKDISGKAEIQLFINGDYDKIELVPKDEKLIKLSTTTIKSGSNCKLTVEAKRVFNQTFVSAKSEGIEVGRLKVTMNVIKRIKVYFFNVNIIDGDYSYCVPEKGWSPKQEDMKAIFLQAGIKLDTFQGAVNINYSDLQYYYDIDRPKAVIVRDEAVMDFGQPEVPLVNILEREVFAHPERYEDSFDAIRVYVFNAARVNDDDFFIFGYQWPDNKRAALIFKISIETLKMEKSNVVAHELCHLFGLNHSYHNLEPYTMQDEGTSNVMDVTHVKYSLTESQWKTVHANAMMRFR